MKAVLFTLVTLFSMNVMADQCQALSNAEAERAALLLQKNSVVTDFCEPCMDNAKAARVGRTSVVNKVKIEVGASYTQVLVNDKAIDLAYTFVQVAPNRSVNLAKAIGCSTLDESSVSSVIDMNLKTIR